MFLVSIMRLYCQCCAFIARTQRASPSACAACRMLTLPCTRVKELATQDARHTSHVTRHTSHVTRHTSHVTRHTSCRTSTIPHRTQHARCTFAPQRQGGGHCRTCKCVRVCVCVCCLCACAAQQPDDSLPQKQWLLWGGAGGLGGILYCAILTI